MQDLLPRTDVQGPEFPGEPVLVDRASMTDRLDDAHTDAGASEGLGILRQAALDSTVAGRGDGLHPGAHQDDLHALREGAAELTVRVRSALPAPIGAATSEPVEPAPVRIDGHFGDGGVRIAPEPGGGGVA